MTKADFRLHIEDPAQWLESAGWLDLVNRYLDLLEDENKRINLVSRETSRGDLVRLAAESLVPLSIPMLSDRPVEKYLDIGSGGGFPAIPIALARQPRSTTLVERRQKKSAALHRIGNQLEIPKVDSIAMTLEEIKFEQKFDLITLRLVRLDKPLLKRISALLSTGGHFVYYFKPSTELSTSNCSSLSYCYTIVNPDQSRNFTIFTKK